MNICVNILSLSRIRRQAEDAANNRLGQQACEYPNDSVAAYAWQQYYSERVQALEKMEEVA